MLSDESSMTDIDDLDYVPSTRKKKSKTNEPKGAYRIHNALKPPRATTYTAQALYEQIVSADIDLDPEYQRGVVWPDSKQIGLIDSIFRNFYIPPVIFVVKMNDDGSESRICVDGKQRLTSIQRFMDGMIWHKDPMSNDKYWYKDVGTKSARKALLPEHYRRIFANKQIVCVEYQDITGDDEREIFQRVQLGMALTPAEKLQAISSPRANLIRQLMQKYLVEGSLNNDVIEWDTSRGADFRILGQIVYALDAYPSTAMVSILQLEKWLDQPKVVPQSLVTQVEETFEILIRLSKDKKLNEFFKKPNRMSPVEVIHTCLLIGVYKDKCSLEQLSKGIAGLRADVRLEHVDIRMNSKVGKTMLTYIKEIKPSKLPGAGPSASSLLSTAPAAPKRKRSKDEEEDPKPEPPKTKRTIVQPMPETKKSKSGSPIPAKKEPEHNLVSQPTPPPSATASKFPISNGGTSRLATLRATHESMSKGVLAQEPLLEQPNYTPAAPLSPISQPSPPATYLEGMYVKNRASLVDSGDSLHDRDRDTQNKPNAPLLGRYSIGSVNREPDRPTGYSNGHTSSNSRDWDRDSRYDRDRDYRENRADFRHSGSGLPPRYSNKGSWQDRR